MLSTYQVGPRVSQAPTSEKSHLGSFKFGPRTTHQHRILLLERKNNARLETRIVLFAVNHMTTHNDFLSRMKLAQVKAVLDFFLWPGRQEHAVQLW